MTALLALLLLAAAPSRAAEPSLSFVSTDRPALSVTAADLRGRKDVRLIELNDPFYGKVKHYRAVPLKNLLTEAYGPTWIENGVGEIFFEALDGYRSHAKTQVLSEDGGMVAFADADVPLWEEMPKEKIKPGPFYLVWTG
ncbi:MAG: hypothetical protein KGJ84_17315, partial [Elusimicrobia bacterium]|nr:hypothetical protein [Elusimicrobiota bacterium]